MLHIHNFTCPRWSIYVAMTYICIRQKCYKLLLISFAMGLTAVCFLYAIWRI